jgi:hypothetical protein
VTVTVNTGPMEEEGRVREKINERERERERERRLLTIK